MFENIRICDKTQESIKSNEKVLFLSNCEEIDRDVKKYI